MDKDKIASEILDAVELYVSSTEVWDDAVLTFDTATGKASVMESEDAEKLPETVDVFDIMDFVEMTPEGKWIADKETIEATAQEI
jgi:hypothetical protein